MALRRRAGRSENSAPVMTLVTQFGGGKAHADGTVPSGKEWKRCGDARQLIEAIHAIDPAQPFVVHTYRTGTHVDLSPRRPALAQVL